MLRKINVSGPLGIFLFACITFAISFAISYGWAQRNHASVPPPTLITPLGRDRDQDGLRGPVNRVKTETAQLSAKSGRLVEGPRELLESTTYDPQGKRVDNSYFLVSASSQPGTEEYARDDKGNVREMTLRDSSNKIVRKEVYTYEYDAVGNWVKMVTSTVIYDGGKVAPQPTEVTYRNISYYFDQAIAEIVAPSTTATGGPFNEQAELVSLRSALEGWVAATNARDLDALMKFYSSKVNAFYRAKGISQEFVRADRSRLFQRAESIEVTASEPEININSDERTASMRFRKGYVIKVGGRDRHGEVIQQLQWERTDDGWKIVGERDLRVLRTD
ncbi:MAG TPA: nuclear transport factor 2 family protein [Pyrinomonadaceae bacterium]|jgi:ketosteroid isomerase-like protein